MGFCGQPARQPASQRPAELKSYVGAHGVLRPASIQQGGFPTVVNNGGLGIVAQQRETTETKREITRNCELGMA
jgi:hypothetical protein